MTIWPTRSWSERDASVLSTQRRWAAESGAVAANADPTGAGSSVGATPGVPQAARATTATDVRSRRAAGVALSFLAIAAIGAWTRTPAPEVITVRGLVVVDSAGRERITIGAMPGRRRSPAIGMAIRDSLGDERFGVGLAADGLM